MHTYMLGTRRVRCTEIRNCRCSSCRVGLKRRCFCFASLTIEVQTGDGQKSIGMGGLLSWSREGRE